ncbi:MAG: MBL fold metallo-hydrolase [Eubacterium sp.]|nr:MBL fold metallo-hydrolase [Eubacterium sp.]
MAKILYQGHGSLRLTSDRGTVAYIDPYIGDGYDKPADLILVTHQHHDHNRIDLPLRARDCTVIQNMDALKGNEYQKFTVKDIQIEATEAYNDKHPKDECVGYLVNVDGICVYFAGDTAQTAQMGTLADRKIDYAFLPIDGIYTMNAREAVKCAQIIKAKHVIPIHMAPGKLFDARVAEKFVTEGAMIVKPGDEIELER